MYFNSESIFECYVRSWHMDDANPCSSFAFGCCKLETYHSEAYLVMLWTNFSLFLIGPNGKGGIQVKSD